MTGEAEPPPAWLVAWRAKQGEPSQPLPSQPVRSEQVRALKKRHPAYQGFLEPKQWPRDDGTRREPVLDLDHTPPRVVRLVGWRPCLRCRRLHFSPDVQRVRLCSPCKDVHQ